MKNFLLCEPYFISYCLKTINVMRLTPSNSIGKTRENRFLRVARDSFAFSFIGFNCYSDCEPSKEPMPWTEAIQLPCEYFLSSFDGTSKVLCPSPVVGPSVCLLLLLLLHVLLVSSGFQIIILCKSLSWQNHFSCIALHLLWVDMKQNDFQESCSLVLLCFAEDKRGANALHLLCDRNSSSDLCASTSHSFSTSVILAGLYPLMVVNISLMQHI